MQTSFEVVCRGCPRLVQLLCQTMVQPHLLLRPQLRILCGCRLTSRQQLKLSVCLCAAGGFPIGFASSGAPIGMQVFGPPGYDGTVLSILSLLGPVFGETPAPPKPSLCAGCTANVAAIEV